MSLASKIAHLFSPLQAQHDQAEIPSQLHAAQSDGLLPSRDARSNGKVSMEEEEEVRHPYVHVRKSSRIIVVKVDAVQSVCWLVE